jgi:NADH:ubiquinone oxidoreductase subunit 5 (subunit L)/multisubunit Na+/H+ antiporter MnhA subunit
LCLLLSTYWQLPTARDGVRRTATAFLFGDLALWAAVGLVTARRGTVALQDLGAKQFTGPLVPVVAVLVVIAALSRSAQIPFHRWLPATLAAPTPVSALLHAGVVNAGGILLVRLSPLATTEVAVGLTILAGATTMAYGAVIMLVKPDIKGALAHSTMAQMGFMILTCGLGLWAAAVIHLVAHGFYKATLFLSSGSAIAHHRRQAALPPAQRLTGRHRLGGLATALLLPLIALYAAVRLVGLPPGAHSAAQALLLFAEATGAATTWGWLQRRPDLGGAVSAAVFLLPAAVGYVAVIDAVSGFLAPALPDPTLPTTTILAIVTVALISLGGLAALWYSPAATPVQRVLYTRALSAGHLTPRPTGART